MIEYFTKFEWNGTLGILLYWVPFAFCVYGYTMRTWFNYQKDHKARDEAATKKDGYYSPTETVGRLIGRAICTITPVANLWAACFDLGPKIFSRFFSWIGRVFDQPLVPKR